MLLVLASMMGGLAGRTAPKHFDPDPEVCQVVVIRTTFLSNLLPWRDQQEVVQQRLRELQAAMTRDTVRDCLAKGLLQPVEADTLIKELGLQAAPGSPSEDGLPQPPTRP